MKCAETLSVTFTQNPALRSRWKLPSRNMAEKKKKEKGITEAAKGAGCFGCRIGSSFAGDRPIQPLPRSSQWSERDTVDKQDIRSKGKKLGDKNGKRQRKRETSPPIDPSSRHGGDRPPSLIELLQKGHIKNGGQCRLSSFSRSGPLLFCGRFPHTGQPSLSSWSSLFVLFLLLL